MIDKSHLDTTPLTEDPLFISKDIKVYMLGDWTDKSMRNQGPRDIENSKLNIESWESFGYKITKQQKVIGDLDLLEESWNRYGIQLDGFGSYRKSSIYHTYKPRENENEPAAIELAVEEIKEKIKESNPLGQSWIPYEVPGSFIFDLANFLDHMRMWEKLKSMKGSKGFIIINPHNRLIKDISPKIFRYGIVGLGAKTAARRWIDQGTSGNPHIDLFRVNEFQSLLHIDYLPYIGEKLPALANPKFLQKKYKINNREAEAAIGSYKPTFDPYAPAYFITPNKARQLYKKYLRMMVNPYWCNTIIPIEIKRELNSVGIDFNQGYTTINDIYANYEKHNKS